MLRARVYCVEEYIKILQYQTRYKEKSGRGEGSIESRQVGGSGSRVEVGVEVHGRGVRHGGGCIDCVRLVRREEVRRDRERTIEE